MQGLIRSLYFSSFLILLRPLGSLIFLKNVYLNCSDAILNVFSWPLQRLLAILRYHNVWFKLARVYVYVYVYTYTYTCICICLCMSICIWIYIPYIWTQEYYKCSWEDGFSVTAWYLTTIYSTAKKYSEKDREWFILTTKSNTYAVTIKLFIAYGPFFNG